MGLKPTFLEYRCYVNEGDSGLTEEGSFGACSGSEYDDDDAEAWNVGVQFSQGPWTIGANYINSTHESEVCDEDDDEQEVWGVGANYTPRI